MTAEEEIRRIEYILQKAEILTPRHIRGLLIPSSMTAEFYRLIDYFKGKAINAEKYWKQILEATVNSEKARNDFMKALLDGKIKFTKEE